MKKVRNLCSLLLIAMFLVINCSVVVDATVNTITYQAFATILNSLGMFEGTDKGYELERSPTRVEISVMLIRLLGKEQEVLSGSYSHPFTDVPEWANSYIGYMYENGLTNGIGNNLFGSTLIADAKSYGTFILRSLGYNDSQGDFSWNTALKTCVEKNILTNYDVKVFSGREFLRGDMVYMSFNALSSEMAKGNIRLYESLTNIGVLNSNAKELFDKIRNKNSLKDLTETIIPELGSIHYTFTDDLMGLNMKFNLNTDLTSFEIAENMWKDWRTGVTILDLDNVDNEITGNINFSSWKYYTDNFNIKPLTLSMFADASNQLTYYDFKTYETSMIADSLVIEDLVQDERNSESNEDYIPLKAMSFVQAPSIDFTNDFLETPQKFYISVPGKILYVSGSYEKVDENTLSITNTEEYDNSIIIFR